MVELGHRRIAFIGGDPAIMPRSFSQPPSVEEERLAGYFRVLRESGIAIDNDLVWLGEYIERDGRGENIAGYRETQALLAAPRRPTAIMTGCDIIAAGVMRALYEAALRVPDDVSVGGFDDTLAPLLAPPAALTVTRKHGDAGCSQDVSFPTRADSFGVEWRDFHANIAERRRPRTSIADAREDLALFKRMIELMA